MAFMLTRSCILLLVARLGQASVKTALRGQVNAPKSTLYDEDGKAIDVGHLGNWSIGDAVNFHAQQPVLPISGSSTGVPEEKPRLFFLFLTMSGIKRPELWEAFFKDTSNGVGYPSRAFIHCKHSNLCAMDLAVSNPLGLTQVSTVPSTYCSDLVSPMVQLLQSAVLESTSPNDKFIFLSESTLPMKPLEEVYSTLTYSPDSDFCIYPTDHWVQLELAQNLRALIVKHSQWAVLNQAHAYAMVQNWPSIKQGFQGYAWSIPVYHAEKKGPWGRITNPAGVLPLPMCVDEWAFFGTLYGAFVDQGQISMAPSALPGFGNTSLHFRGDPNLVSTHQGVCRTFAFWDASDMGFSNLINAIVQDWPYSKISCFPKCDSTHPAAFEALSDHGVTALRRSRYLFARKFEDHVLTLDQFQRIILAPSAAAHATQGQAAQWR